MDDWKNHDWRLDLSDLRKTLPNLTAAQLIFALIVSTVIVILVAVFSG